MLLVWVCLQSHYIVNEIEETKAEQNIPILDSIYTKQNPRKENSENTIDL